MLDNDNTSMITLGSENHLLGRTGLKSRTVQRNVKYGVGY